MQPEIPSRWVGNLRRHLVATTGEVRDSLSAHDFRPGRGVRLEFPDGSVALFQNAFHLADDALQEVAVFTEHCGYHFFPAEELLVRVVEST